MIQRLTEVFVGGVELLEAEGRLARHHAVGVSAGLALLLALTIVALAFAALAFVGLIVLIEEQTRLGTGGAIVIVSGPVAALFAIAAVVTYRKMRTDNQRSTT